MLRKIFGLGNKNDQRPNIEDPVAEFNFRQSQAREAGSVDGKHFTSYVEQVKQLKREKKHEEAMELLLKLIAATESQSNVDGFGAAPGYYEQLAIIYRKEKRYADEVAILERFEAQLKGPGATPKVLAERLVKARKLAKEQE